MITPPNCVHLYDNVFIDETEIANIHYLEYLHYLVQDSTEEFFNSQLPDPEAWEIKLQPKDSIDYSLYGYFRYPGYRYFPVIGVSYEQALNYCIWRGNAVTALFKDTSKYPEFKGFDIVIEYRLPTKEEWELAAGASLKAGFPYGTEQPKRKYYSMKKKTCDCDDCLDKNKLILNKNDIIHRVEFNVVDDYYLEGYNSTIICEEDEIPMPSYIYDFPPNVNRIYNMVGNVSEMVFEKNIAKGGSFRDKLSDFDLSTDFSYTGPNEWLGFRCVGIAHIRRKMN